MTEKPMKFTMFQQESLAIAKMNARCALCIPNYLQAIHPNFVHAYGHYTMRGF